MTSSKVTGSSFLKTLGLEEEPHLLVPLVSAMSGVEQLQTLAENMNSTLRSKKGKHDSNDKHIGVATIQLTGTTQSCMVEEESVGIVN